MNEGMKQLLIRYLAELDMYNVIELVNNGADKYTILDLFQKNVLYQNPQYQKWMLNSHMRENMNPEQWDKMTDVWLRQQLFQNHNHRKILQILQFSNEEFDCGCS